MTEAIEKNQLLRVYIEKSDSNCLSHTYEEVASNEESNYSDIIDNEYVVTEVVYYFEQERREQYFQDMLAVNYNDPFYRVLYSLGFRYVTTNAVDNDSVHGFYDFMPNYNQVTSAVLTCPNDPGFDWMEKMPANGMKRVWVRPKQICMDTVTQKEGDFFLTHCNKEVEALDVGARQSAFIKEYPEMTKQVLEIVTKQYNEQEFVELIWDGMFRQMRNIIMQAKNLLSMSLYNVNVLMINDYSGDLEFVEPVTTGRGQLVLLSHYYRFTKKVISKANSYFANKPQEKIGYSNQGSLMNQVAAVRALDINQFDEAVVIVEPKKEDMCKPTENPQMGCLGMTGPIFAGFAAEMEKEWKQKQFTVYGICEASYSGFLNYAMYRFSL